MAAKLMQIVGLILALWLIAAGAAEAVSRSKPPRGQMVDVGGRALRVVCEGPKDAETPVVWMEAGAFGGAADFGAIQQKLAARGIRSCAYDRAGMGFSDPSPQVRDGDAIAGDLEKLIAASGEKGPFILMAHSMGGLYVHEFAARNPDLVAGVVLIDAVTPQAIDAPGADRFVRYFLSIAQLNAAGASVGLTKPAYFFMGDKIGLPEAARAEKRRGAVSGRQARTALNEVEHWREAAEQAMQAGSYDPDVPVAVVTAGSTPGHWENLRRGPERASRAGSYTNNQTANHNSILGFAHNDAIIGATDRVIAGIERNQRLAAAPAPKAAE